MAKKIVKSLDQAANKWVADTSGKGALWKARVTQKAGDYCSNFAKFIGTNPSAISAVCRNYNSGVEATSAESFNAAITAAGTQAYIDGLRKLAMGGGA
ncbi:MAG: hypothetical protein QXO47_10050 [Thermoproteota archaeon]